jgi:hypothetical protein
MKPATILAILILILFAAGVAPAKDSLFVQIAGDSLTICNAHALENCASRFVSSLTLSHDTLTWVQTDTVGPIARCNCTFDMTVSITGLPSGSYLARLFRDRKKQYQYGQDTLEYIGSVAFAVNSTANSFFARAFNQSDCLGTGAIQENVVAVPAQFALQNYPNPFNPKTVVSCQLPVASTVRLVVCDMLGREVVTLLDGQKTAGIFNVPFDGSGLSSGVYFCRLYVEPANEGGNGQIIRPTAASILTTKMTLIR